MSEITPDPNGDRNCNARWPHRDAETIVVDGVAWCAECRKALDETI